ncbi:hypothetical protein L6164_015373 [Bauhinia variegata]|uniref:Uncharacterized protein n=1 Tax=Bauhinia variegata TaxID=167791 RepID=A0ACB9NKC1_BAUVA|nr:hypothetical protein L6164_015373 [Bauhinia variegata]
MERFSRRENIHSSYNLQNQRLSTNPSTPNRNSDVDFHDVFGGPPRRSSIQEMWYGIRELHDSSGVGREDEESAPSCARPRVTEKPVFGEENVSWRRYPSNGFFDGIFGGDESQSCTPRARRHETDPFYASRAFCPACPRPPKTEPFRTSSLPASFSQAGRDKGGFKSDPRPSYGQSLLSQNKADREINLEQHSSNCEIAPGNGQFHFSIYKWASKGVPLAMPLRAERNSRTKERVKIERCSSTKEHKE